MASHSTVPSFTATKKSEAPELELKWDTEKKIYTLTVTDTNNLKINLAALNGSGVSVTRSGNKYTFTSKNMIMDTVSFFVKIKTETYGSAKIVKTSEDGIVSGIPFNISGTDILGNRVDETVTTGENGQIKEKLLPGTYLVKELPVDRYVTPAAQYVTIESGQTATVHFSNMLKKFRVHVVKSDADTGTAQGDATLAGATYGIYNNGELVDTYTTGPDGSFMTRYYVCGDNWTVREIDPSTGYLLNDTVYEVGASPTLYEVEQNTTENPVTETVIYGNIQLVKHTDDPDPDVSEEENTEEPNEGIMERPEAGAVFQVYLKAAGSYEGAKEGERDLLTTDGDGFAASKMLPYGRYTIHQVAGEEGKAFIPDFTVFISSNGQTYSYILNNRTITARLKVEKCDAETGNIIPMTGTGFQIKNLSTGEFVTQEIYYPNPETLDTFYVSDEGWLMLLEPLPTGDYELYEVAAPYGYVLSNDPVPFTIDGSEAVVTVTQYNMPQKGQLTITKTGEVFASDLPFGSYYVKEHTTNSAYILSDAEYPVVFEYAGQEAALVQILVNEGEVVSNELLRGRVDGVKVGENPEGGEDVKLSGALMGLFRPETEEFTEENALLTVTTGEDGSFAFENIPYGHWIVKEIAAPALYTVSPQQHHIYIGVDGQSIEIKVENTLIRGSVQVMKTEAVDEPSAVEKEDEENNTFLRFLSGAEFELYTDTNSNQEFDSEDAKIGTLKETDEGYHTAEDLLAGGYFIKESKAPEGYQLDENVYYFAITEDGQVAVVENGEAGRGFTNEAYRGNLKITKDSSDGRKDGFAIEVKSADGSYCETFTTPKSGVIEVNGLRVGIYTVTEISNRASKDYIIPDAATVEIKANETSTVQLYNEKPEESETPEKPTTPTTPSSPTRPNSPSGSTSNPGKAVPQTGDDNLLY